MPNKPKRSLRSALEDLAATFADAVLAAAREELRDVSPPAPRVARKQVRQAPAAAERPRSRRARQPKVAAPVEVEAMPPSVLGSDLLITDPSALLAAIDTAMPRDEIEPVESHARRKEPEILRAPEAPAPEPSAPVLRGDEVVVRRSAGGIVLRRRRGA